MTWIQDLVAKIVFHARLRRASRIGKRFYARYEHLVKDVPFHPDLRPRLDVYSPPTGSDHPVLLFVHGGSWQHFDKARFAPVAKRLLTESMVVVMPDHTPYPAADGEQMAGEVAAAVSWTLENVAGYGGDPGRVFVGGQSSGAHLAALAVLAPRFLAAYGC
ncbi:MAG: alpha/beta hydrolase, partial [Anaerolineae bacterium]|nr:alpha/beta hydrolase [Anaerolineae bacterium]